MTDHEAPAIPDRWDGQRWLRWDPKSHIWYDASTRSEPEPPHARSPFEGTSGTRRSAQNLGSIAGIPARTFAVVGTLIAIVMIGAGTVTTGAIALPMQGSGFLSPPITILPPGEQGQIPMPAGPGSSAAPREAERKLDISKDKLDLLTTSESARAEFRSEFEPACISDVVRQDGVSAADASAVCQCLAAAFLEPSFLQTLPAKTAQEEKQWGLLTLTHCVRERGLVLTDEQLESTLSA